MANGLFSNLNELYQSNIGQPFVRSPVGQGISGYLGLAPANETSPSEAYRVGQAMGNMPAIGAPSGAFKAATQIPGLLEGLSGAALIGPRSTNPATRTMFDKIKELSSIGATRQDIQKVFPNASLVEVSPGQYAVEISDKAAAFTKKLQPGKETTRKLGEILSHDKLFREYPELKDLDVTMMLDEKQKFPKGDFNKKTKSINISANSPEELLNTLTHEVEHWIQFKEAWPSGGNPNAMKVGLGAYKAQIAKNSKALSDIQQTIQSKQTELANAAPEAAQALEQEIAELNRRAGFFADRVNTFQQLEKYPDSYEGRFAAYADLWGERAARAASDRRLLTEQERLQQPLQAYIDQEIRRVDIRRPEFQGGRPLSLQQQAIRAKEILTPLKTEDPLNKGMKIVIPQDLIPYGDLYSENPLNMPYGNAP